MLDETLGSSELSLWFARLGTLLGFGSPISATLEVLNESTADPELRAANDELRRGLAAGESLSSTMAREPDLWPPAARFLVQVGEAAGILDYVATDLSRVLDAGPPATSERGLFCLALARLMGVGRPLAEALPIAAQILYRPNCEAVCRLAGELETVTNLTDALGQVMALDPVTRQLLKVGERSGRLDQAALRAAQLLEVEARQGPTT